MFKGLDHIAIVVRDTEAALPFYRDILGLPLLFSETLPDQPVRLTHLDLGGPHLQLVEPLSRDHPLNKVLDERGESLHHLCFSVENIPDAMKSLPDQGLPFRAGEPHSAPNGRAAAFFDTVATRGILLEITGHASEDSDQG